MFFIPTHENNMQHNPKAVKAIEFLFSINLTIIYTSFAER